MRHHRRPLNVISQHYNICVLALKSVAKLLGINATVGSRLLNLVPEERG